MQSFIGRKQELAELRRVHEGRMASLVIIKGRRRIGKSRLIAEFASQYQYYPFMGLTPRKGITAQDQRNEFIRQLKSHFGLSVSHDNDWGDLFSTLAKHTQKGNIVILFDEISWMADNDPDFLGKLKIIWDLEFTRNTQLMLILCGSVSSWIEDNILSSTGYLGRPNLHMTLRELPLSDCNQFWGELGKNISAYEKLKLLSVTGGVPRYLELMNPSLTAEENIRLMCFNKNGPLFDEFKYIFSDIYGKKSDIYIKIVEFLSSSKASREDISKHTHLSQSGDLTKHLTALEQGGFIVRDYTWDTKTGKESKLSYYRLSDNYTRFYLKYILPQKTMIEKNKFENTSLSSLPGWYTILGLQFENMVIRNHETIRALLGIKAEDVVMENPYFQKKTTRQAGCQIDYMIQTKHDTVYICEIKFKRHEIGMSIIKEVTEKINNLKLPKHISRRPVLIHVNGVKDEVIDEQFFSKIIDFSQVLES